MSMVARRWICALAVMFLAAFSVSPAAAAEPPRLDLTFTPRPTGGPDSYLGVEMRLESPALKAGEGLVRLPLKLVGIPSARYDGDALKARDDKGPLPLAKAEEPPTPQGVYRRWNVTRPTVGDVVVTYRAPPRPVTEATNNGPLFDLREEAGGFIGAGVGFLAAPVSPGPWRVRLKWDLSHAPPGSSGASTMGDGDVERVLPSEALAFSFYAAGPLKTYPADPSDGFTLYWLSKPPFDPAVLGERIKKLYDGMADFFEDEGSSYRVFVRSNPYRGVGGTALGRSFMFGYHAPSNPTVEDLHHNVSHELAHTWPAMEGEHGETAWYSEGAAEYYSLILSWRAGVVGVEEVVEALNEKAHGYYSNPHRALSNAEAAKIFWTDPLAQKVPYGRGFMYLVETNAAIRKASGGRRGLDDVVKEIRRRQVAGEAYGIEDWLRLVGKEIGDEQAQAGYRRMASGGLLTPPDDLYAPCLGVEKHPVRPLELGFARSSLNDERIVRGLVPGSAAEKAGIRDGDVIVEMSDFDKAREDEAQTFTLTVRRGDERLTVTYLPRGAPTEAYRWVRNAQIPEAACRF